MAPTYKLIASNILTSAAANVTFSSIPSTYTDLVVRWSSRAATDTSAAGMQILINSSTSSYSYTAIRVQGGSNIQATQGSSATALEGFSNQPNDYTSSTFSSGEIYIPNYAVAINKSYGLSNVIENNSSTTNYSPMFYAGLWSNTATISSLLFRSQSGNLASGSSFYLYGISKN